MRNYFLSFIFAILSITSGALADVSSVVVDGRAIITGVDNTLIKKRAIADALENFLYLQGGEVHSSILSENGEIIFDRIHFKSNASVLGFDLLGSQQDDGQVTVTLEVFFNTKYSEDVCHTKQDINLSLLPTNLRVGSGAPNFSQDFNSYLDAALLGIVLEYANVLPHSAQTSELNYATLLNATVNDTPPGDTMTVEGILRYSPAAMSLSFEAMVRSDNRYLEPELGPIRVTARTRSPSLLSPQKGFLRDKHEVFEELTTPLISMLAHALQKARCKPISGVVKLVGKNHTVNLGSVDGITASSLFMLTDGSRGVFKPVKIFNEMSTVVALTSSPTGSLYQNKQVYLLK